MDNRSFKLPPLEWVRAFEAAARCGSFTAAALDTGLTQSAVSQRIGNLEKMLGTVLFHRKARSISLTIEGEAWLPHVRTALDGLRESSETLFGAERGRMVFSASQSIIELWLMPRLEGLSETTNAQISVQTMVLGAHDTPPDEVIGVRYGSGEWAHTYKKRLYSEKIAPVAAPSLIERAGVWSDWPRIACAGPRPGWNDWAAQFGISTTPLPWLRFDTFLSALGAARAGLGVTLASLPLCKADLDAGRLVQLSEDVMSHHESYWLIAGREAIARTQWNALVDALT